MDDIDRFGKRRAIDDSKFGARTNPNFADARSHRIYGLPVAWQLATLYLVNLVARAPARLLWKRAEIVQRRTQKNGLFHCRDITGI